ncbi:phage neck terminator protein [Weissella coleopterorum]|uniref:phage neck terminator protein n=1 Tax=Weissella coleopterorum TaxID=2714949 RepID=UPI003CCCC7A3
MNEHEIFEAVVSFTLFSYTKLQALNLAENLRKLMYSDTAREDLRKQEIIIVEVMPTNIRSIQSKDNDKFMVGFDMRLRLRDPYGDDIPEMDSIEFNET